MKAFRAPGRVNLIGDHTDYNEGFVLPMAIDLECVVRVQPRDAVVRLVSADREPVELAADGSDDPRRVEPDWGRYVAGVVRILAEEGRQPAGIEGEIESTVPAGSGLSSSAALEVSLALALADAGGLELRGEALALACQRAEHAATGVPSGVMDQLASVCGVENHALLIDCRSLDVRPVAVPPYIAVLVVHSGLPRRLDATAYADRRAKCERDAAELGVASLRDVRPEDVGDRPRARHVTTENERVLDAAGALDRGDPGALGELLLASHASLRDDFEVSTPELDVLVESLVSAGALGARLTGAGFGGSVVAVAPAEIAPDVLWRGAAAYAAETGLEPTTWLPHAAGGAGPLE